MNHSIRNSFLTLTVAEEGGEMQSILGTNGIEYLWQGNPTYWQRRATNLFPMVGRLFDKTYTWEGKAYQLASPHGFVRESLLTLTGKTEDSLTFTLTENEKTLSVYPFPFCYQIIYTLKNNTVEITYRVENTGTATLPFGIGGHPGFNVPLSGDHPFEDWCVTFSKPCSPKQLHVTDAGHISGVETDYPLQDGTTLPLRHELFHQDAIILKDMDRTVSLHCPKEEHSVTVSFPDMQYVGLWHAAKTDAPFLCIEPWYTLPGRDGVIEDFGKKEDIIRLSAGGVYENTITITMR